MKATPADLRRMQAKIVNNSGNFQLNGIGLALAMLKVCRELEPGMTWPLGTEDDHSTWVSSIPLLEGELSLVLTMQTGLGRHTNTNTAIGVSTVPLHELVRIAEERWIGPGRGDVREFPGMQDLTLRKIAERDYRSMTVAQQAEEPKTTTVMAGSVTEAVLLDLMLRKQPTAVATATAIKGADPGMKGSLKSSNPKNWSLDGMIAVAGDSAMGDMTEPSMKAADAAKNLRNYIHPGKEFKQSRLLRASDAQLAVALLECVLDDLGL